MLWLRVFSLTWLFLPVGYGSHSLADLMLGLMSLADVNFALQIKFVN